MTERKSRGRLELTEGAEAVGGRCDVAGCAYNAGHYAHSHKHYTYGDYTFSVADYEKIEMYDGPLFKWVDEEGRSAYGGYMQWDLPKDGKPGAWAEPDKKVLATCNHGLHALLPGQRGFGGHGRLFIAEADGPVMFTHGKVVTSRLRLVREVDLNGVITPEMEQAHWKKHVQAMTEKPSHHYYSYSRTVPKTLQHLIKGTRAGTLRAVRAAAKPLLKELMEIQKALATYQRDFDVLTGGPKPPRDWTEFNRLGRERAKLRRQLKRHEFIANQTKTKPSYMAIPRELLSPDLALYMSDPPKEA